jgi:hypothetical protein
LCAILTEGYIPLLAYLDIQSLKLERRKQNEKGVKGIPTV